MLSLYNAGKDIVVITLKNGHTVSRCTVQGSIDRNINYPPASHSLLMPDLRVLLAGNSSQQDTCSLSLRAISASGDKYTI